MTEDTRMKRTVVAVIFAFCALVLGITIFMNYKSARDQQAILEDSIKSQLTSICIAAREAIDPEEFITWTSLAAVEADAGDYIATRQELRLLAERTGADYIYVLRKMGDEYIFVLDSDPEDEEVFIPYPPSEVHIEAYLGNNAAGVMNVVDEYGSFNTGAVPIWYGGQVVGIVCADIEDTYIQQSEAADLQNTILLVAALVVAMAVMVALVFVLLRRLRSLQTKLQHMAHHDAVTGLPNRQYLLEYLDQLTKTGKPFALLFIDLDNFKAVNDNAGHDAGDELLRHIAGYLQDSLPQDGKSFRPSAGSLNVAARIGGDEFVQVVNGIADTEEAARVARALLDGFTSTHLDKYIEKYQVGLSIGVALFPYHTDNFHVLIKYADIAMYHAKKGGKNGYRIYQDDMEAKPDK